MGQYGTGTLTIQNGGSVTNTIGYLGGIHDGIGTATIDGVGSSWTISGSLSVGQYGSGTLTVQNGGSVSNIFGSVGSRSSGTGTVTVDGALSKGIPYLGSLVWPRFT